MATIDIIEALRLTLSLILPLLGVMLAGALIAGILRVAMQIEDGLISFVGKLIAVLAFLYLASSSSVVSVTDYATRIWGGNNSYK